MFLPATAYGGPTSVSLSQAQRLAQLGVEVEVASTTLLTLRPVTQLQPGTSAQFGFPVHYFHASVFRHVLPSIHSWSYLSWLMRHVTRYDAVHIHFARELFPVATCLISRIRGVRYFVQPHGMLNTEGTLKTWLDRLVTRRLLESARGVLVLQEHERRRLQEIAPRARIHVLPNGIASQKVPYSWDADRLAGRTILFLARLHPRKRVLDFIEAALLLQAQGMRFQYRIVGSDGGDLAAAQNRIRDHGLTDCVTLVGELSPEECYQEMARASIYVLPSVEEPFPMSVLEALAIGVPTVVTTGIHIGGMLENHQAAEVVEPAPQALADGILKLWTEPQRATQQSRNGRRLIETELDIDRVADSLLTVYGQ